MGEADLARDLGEVRATVASELGRLKADFTVLVERVEKVREQSIGFSQTVGLATQLDTKLQRASDEINTAIRRIETLERASGTTEKYIDRELLHLRTEIKQDIAKAILELDNSIKDRLPATTIMDSINELFDLSHRAYEAAQRMVNSREDVNDGKLSDYKTATDSKLKSLSDDLKVLADKQTKQEIESSKQSVRLGVIIAGIGIILNLVLGFIVKKLTEPITQPSVTRQQMQQPSQQQTQP